MIMRANREIARKRPALRRREAIDGYLFAAPWILGLLIFSLGPMIASIYYGFTDYDILGSPRWTGLGNYTAIFTEDPLFYKSLFNTILYTLISVPLGLFCSLLMAVLLNQKLRWIRIFRTIYYLPAVMSGIAVMQLWLWIFNADYGLLNYFLSLAGIKGPMWLANEFWAKPALILMGLWGAGSGMIIFLAGLQGIPEQLYEAAEIDGAGKWQRFWRITIPMLSPTIFFNLIVGIIGAFQTFVNAMVMTNGGPLDSTLFYVLHLWRNAFVFYKMGYASALAWVLFVIIMFFTLINFRYSKKWVHYGGENAD